VDNSWFQYTPPAPQTISYAPADPDNGYTSSTSDPGQGSITYTYDGNHNLTFDGVHTLTYDVENRLIKAQNAAWVTSQYQYDPLGHRSQKQVGEAVTQFVLAGSDEIADYSCYSGTCTPWTLTVRGVGGLPVASITPATGGQGEAVAFYHHDVLGSTTAATAEGTDGPAEVYLYSEFGMPIGGSLPYEFAGYRYDSETGLYYVKARYYSPNMGRFLQTDPIGIAGGRNQYAYVNNDPLNLVDPTGLCPDTSKPSQDCLNALATAGASTAALTRATNNWSLIQSAASANGIDPNLLAAIAIRETGFQNIPQSGGGQGAGVFQIDLGQNPAVTSAQAYDIKFAANYAANMLATNRATLASQHPNLNPTQLQQATVASYNFGTGNISGNPNTIDVGSTGGNYGSNVLGLMTCFH